VRRGIHTLKMDSKSFLLQRDALIHEISASHPAVTEDILLSALNEEDDPRFCQLLDLTQNANAVRRTETESTWSAWPRGSWACICEATLLGPFLTHEAAIEHVRSIPRSCFGAFSWQVGIPPTSLRIG
jgi:hypothetical protein